MISSSAAIARCIGHKTTQTVAKRSSWGSLPIVGQRMSVCIPKKLKITNDQLEL